VVQTLRQEKDNLNTALANQREAMNSIANKLQQQTYRLSELEEENIRVSANYEDDRRTI
jgi:uncharacterized coiled-coil protein SlyX